MKNQVQLITYVDRFGGGCVSDLCRLLSGPLSGMFGGVHILPFFYPVDGADAGFDPIDHTRVDPRLGSWDDVKNLGDVAEVMADLIVNHVSSDSPQFRDFSRNGGQSEWAGLFLTFDRVFPGGATEEQLLEIYRPRPGLPFTMATLENGERRLLWTTFTARQVDIDVLHPHGSAYLSGILARFHEAGIRMIRLDAAGYAIKEAGTSCFMLPRTYEFIGQLTTAARALGMEVLVEIHSYYQEQIEIAKHVDRVYDFALPPLVLHALIKGDARFLRKWLRVSPRNCITVLDTHDGIGVIDVGADASAPQDRPGLLPPAEIDELVEAIHRNSGGGSRKATGAAASNLDLYQVNCTYYDALGRDDRAYLIARAIQFFAPGIPQVYYVGLLAGENDMELLARTQVGRDINRHRYSPGEIDAALARPVVAALCELIRFRNTHPAFEGEFSMNGDADDQLSMRWEREGSWAQLDVDLTRRSARIGCSGGDTTVGIDTEFAMDFLVPGATR